MSIQEIENLAISLMREHGLLDTGWKFKWDNAKRRGGRCQWSNKTISLSRHIIPQFEDWDVRNTILHEIAHALTPYHGHDKVWRAKAIEIGCSGDRCYSDSAFKQDAVKPQSKYTLVCDSCGNEHPMHRKRSRSYSCHHCYPYGYNEDYKLREIQNY